MTESKTKKPAGEGALKAREAALKLHETYERDVELLRRGVRDKLAELDQKIVAKEAEYDALILGSVSNEDAAAMIVESLRGTVASALAEATRRALWACDLSSHRPTRRYAWDPAAGHGCRETTHEAAGLKVLPGGYNESALLGFAAVFWSEEAAMRFARSVLSGRVEPAHGLGVEQLHAKAERLADEIREMYEARWALHEKVGGFVDIGPVYAPPAPAPLAPAEYAMPSVRVAGDDGVMRETVIGHSLQEQIGFAEKRRQAEERQRLEAERAAVRASAEREADRLDDLVTMAPDEGRWAGLLRDDDADVA